MKNDRNIKTLFFMFLSSILLFSCSKKYDLDLSNLPKPNLPKPKKVVNTNKESEISDESIYLRELVPLESSEQLLSKFKFGKKDPFSKSETKENQFSSDFRLTGFLNTNIEKYVFVSFLGNEGTISEESIGGLNTNLLPKGAKVINIDIKKRLLKINYDKEDFIFEF